MCRSVSALCRAAAEPTMHVTDHTRNYRATSRGYTPALFLLRRDGQRGIRKSLLLHRVSFYLRVHEFMSFQLSHTLTHDTNLHFIQTTFLRLSPILFSTTRAELNRETDEINCTLGTFLESTRANGCETNFNISAAFHVQST